MPAFVGTPASLGYIIRQKQLEVSAWKPIFGGDFSGIVWLSGLISPQGLKHWKTVWQASLFLELFLPFYFRGVINHTMCDLAVCFYRSLGVWIHSSPTEKYHLFEREPPTGYKGRRSLIGMMWGRPQSNKPSGIVGI